MSDVYIGHEDAWDMNWCDPCAADAREKDVFVTRLHVRYDSEQLPADLVFQETGDRQNFQGRYVIRRAWKGEATCDISNYQAELRNRQEREAEQLANLTGWDIEDIRRKIPFAEGSAPLNVPWWKKIWS